MTAHGELRNLCPYCLEKFETRQAVKAHQKAKRHRTIDRQDNAEQVKALASYNDDLNRRKKEKWNERVKINQEFRVELPATSDSTKEHRP